MSYHYRRESSQAAAQDYMMLLNTDVDEFLNRDSAQPQDLSMKVLDDDDVNSLVSRYNLFLHSLTTNIKQNFSLVYTREYPKPPK